MKIVFDPKSSKGNKYIDIIVDRLEIAGYSVISVSDIYQNIKSFFQVKIVHLNWFENLNTPFDFLKKNLEALYSFAGWEENRLDNAQ